MRKLFLASLTVLLAGCVSSGTKEPLRTVSRVDLDRYSGRWYVIANIPYILEKGKVASYDTYGIRPDGRLQNDFTFRKGSFDAPEQTWKGVAWIHNPATNAEWRVQFIWPFRVTYLVIDLDPEYRWAVVGHPSRNYLWVLARERSLSGDVYRGILDRAAAQGYDASRILPVPQPAP